MSADSGDSAGEGPNGGATTTYPGTPRWVKVFGLVVLVLILLLIVAAVASGGQHGPMRHVPSGAPGGPILPTAQGVQP